MLNPTKAVKPVKASGSKSAHRIGGRYWNKYKSLYLLMLPGILFLIIFRYIPLYGITIAFKDFQVKKGILGSDWVGLEHFIYLFGNRSFWSVLGNTVIMSFYKMIFGFPAPIILALVINELKNVRYKKLVQTFTYMPHFISWVVVAGIFLQLLSPGTGPINFVIKSFGMDPVYFLGDPRYFRGTMVFTGIWKSVGWDSVIYIAALTGIDTGLYEAATIDGCTRLKRIWYITIPSIMPIIVMMLIMRSGKLIEDNFDQIFNFLNDGVLSVGDVISTYVYRLGIEKMKYSYATAVDVFRNVVSFVLVFLTNTIAKKAGEEGLW